ncbi:MAG: hypothetical protein H0W83_09225 [Planctomycetes bacterium]|nr:hypothetical protein [Planctomycetota bacterium]
MKKLTIPILVITLGVAWLLSTLDVLHAVNWVWVLGLGVSGALILAVGGVTRSTFVFGPFLIICSLFSIARQSGRISANVEMPTLVIIFGLLSLLAAILPIREPSTKP